MTKAKWNFIIEAIMLALMAVIAGLGLLIKYVLLSGSDRWIKYDRSVDLFFWGLDRHDWGKIHLILAIILGVLLVLHIILHWNMIVGLYKKFFKNRTTRIVIGVCFTIITILLIVFPFMIKIEIEETLSGRERYASSEETENSIVKETETTIKDAIQGDLPIEKSSERTEQHKKYEQIQHEEHSEHAHHNIDPSIEVKGYMTLKETSEQYNVPCDYIKNKLDIPKSVSNSSKLGTLRKQYGFKMSEVENIISNYLNSANK